MGSSVALRDEWRRFDEALESNEAALAVQGRRRYRRSWHQHSIITVGLRLKWEAKACFLRENGLENDVASGQIAKALRVRPEERTRIAVEVLTRRCRRWEDDPTHKIRCVMIVARTRPPRID